MEFILNHHIINTDQPSGMTVLDFVRYHQHLTATKIGCREGDCGACTVLIGDLENGKVQYQSMTSCLTPLGNISGKHIVTLEGLNVSGLSSIQKALVDEGGTQCGFCTPGFIVSFYGLALSERQPSRDESIMAIDGNICRCTGYKSIERAAERIIKLLATRDLDSPVGWLVEKEIIPDYFKDIPSRLSALRSKLILRDNRKNGKKIAVGGGTDLYVQIFDDLIENQVLTLFDDKKLNGIELKNGICKIGAETTVTDLLHSEKFQSLIPNLQEYLKLISSTQIRNMGTIAGNFVNASPIGDLSIFFLALNTSVLIKDINGEKRMVPLQQFFKGYKDIELKEGEIIEKLEFEVLEENSFFNFEKVSKRTYLDIASVNSALRLKVNDINIIETCHLSAGGVGPIPLYLNKISRFLEGKELQVLTVRQSLEFINDEISPISDVRGSSEYKTLLLRQLICAHFIELFPNKFSMEDFLV